jgi:hypothetical protein
MLLSNRFPIGMIGKADLLVEIFSRRRDDVISISGFPLWKDIKHVSHHRLVAVISRKKSDRAAPAARAQEE